MKGFNALIHQPLRLRIMATLTGLGVREAMSFAYLRDLLQATDGNLGAHLQKLEEAGYLTQKKRFVARVPHTDIAATEAGRVAYLDHVGALRRIIEGL